MLWLVVGQKGIDARVRPEIVSTTPFLSLSFSKRRKKGGRRSESPPRVAGLGAHRVGRQWDTLFCCSCTVGWAFLGGIECVIRVCQ